MAPGLLVALAMLFGCGGSGSSNPPAPPTPPTPPVTGSVAFSTPMDGSTVKALPVTLGFTLEDGAALANVKVTLNGTDISYAFTATGTAATAGLSRGIYVGSNRLNATIGGKSATATFNYDPSTTKAGGSPPGAGSSTTLTDVIPVQTRIRTTNAARAQVWGIQIGQQAYPAPDTTSGGFQVLVLKRTTCPSSPTATTP